MEHRRQPTAIVKIGTDVMTDGEGHLDEQIIQRLVEQIMLVKGKINQVLLVTSGAVAEGRAEHEETKRGDEDIDTKGMYASCGQPVLMNLYREYLKTIHDCIAYQFLVTKEIFSSNERSQTLLRRLKKISESKKQGLPIFNENDAIADEEIMFTDNDELAGLLAGLVKAEVVVLLTGDVDGVQKDRKDKSSLIAEIALSQQEDCRRFVLPGTSGNGKGGMDTKYDVACKLAQQGTQVHIANGRIPNILERILLKGERSGTVFLTH